MKKTDRGVSDYEVNVRLLWMIYGRPFWQISQFSFSCKQSLQCIYSPLVQIYQLVVANERCNSIVICVYLCNFMPYKHDLCHLGMKWICLTRSVQKHMCLHNIRVCMSPVLWLSIQVLVNVGIFFFHTIPSYFIFACISIHVIDYSYNIRISYICFFFLFYSKY